jgi:hypothetical protein
MRVASIAATLCVLFAPGVEARQLGPVNNLPDLGPYKHVMHVSQKSGSDTTGDGSKEKPLATITAALKLLEDVVESSRSAILVASGTYPQAFQMRAYVDMFGGFDGATWNRNIDARDTILDGEHTHRPVIGADHAILDGFVIRNGRAMGPGGGILCRRSSPTISNCVIVDNLAVEPPDYIYGMFHQVGNDGGGIACVDGSRAVIVNNIIARNKTNIGGGGGIAARNMSLPVIENNIICDNRTGLKDNNPDKKKRARSSNGGGISMSNASSLENRARIANNVISGNSVGGNSDAGGIYCEYDSSPEILHNILLNNTCEDDGAAIYVMKLSDPFISGNIFAGNNGGGTIRLSKEGRAHIHNNLFFGNPSGGISCVDAWMLCSNNTIVDNPGAGGFINRHFASMKPSVYINNLFYADSGNGGVSVESPDAPKFVHCNIRGGAAGEGNFDADPKVIRDGISGQIKSIAFDASASQTRLVAAESIADPQKWLGRALRAGRCWGVIAQATDNELVVWGDLTDASNQPSQFAIASSYRLGDDSPCVGKGMKISEDLVGPLAPLPEASAETMKDVGANLMIPASNSKHTTAAPH